MRSSEKPTIQALTGLRFFAALHVILFHMTMGHITEYPVLVRNFLLAAPIAVEFFFVLSGFILTINYVGADPTVRIHPPSFWLARFARIVPVYLLGLIGWLPIYVRET